MSPVLHGLARATNSDPYDTSELALSARARERMMRDASEEDAVAQEQPFGGGYGLDLNRGDRNRRLLGQSDMKAPIGNWDAFFESIREAGERQGTHAGYDMSETSLADSPVDGTVPLSLQGLQHAQYGYTNGGRPAGVRFKR
jgi:hypothetical protein